MQSSEIACRDCIDYKFRPNNYVWDETVQPGHFCKWCGKEKPELIWFRFENRILAEIRKNAERERQERAMPKRDTRAQYREPWRDE